MDGWIDLKGYCGVFDVFEMLGGIKEHDVTL